MNTEEKGKTQTFSLAFLGIFLIMDWAELPTDVLGS